MICIYIYIRTCIYIYNICIYIYIRFDNAIRGKLWPLQRMAWVIYLSAYARQPARGPTMLAHLVAMLAYVGRC